MELTTLLGINVSSIHKRNKSLIKLMQIDTFSKKDLKTVSIINYTQPEKNWSIYDVHNYLLNRISPDLLINDTGKPTIFAKNIIKFIAGLDDLIIRRGINIKGPLYRCMREPYINDTIITHSHWSLIPDWEFCNWHHRSNWRRFYVYKLYGNCTGLYINNSNITKESKYFRQQNDFQVILPRNLKFKITKTEVIKTLNFNYIYEFNKNNVNKWTHVIIYHIILE
jgi:hypothetical protein